MEDFEFLRKNQFIICAYAYNFESKFAMVSSFPSSRSVDFQHTLLRLLQYMYHISWHFFDRTALISFRTTLSPNPQRPVYTDQSLTAYTY